MAYWLHFQQHAPCPSKVSGQLKMAHLETKAAGEVFRKQDRINAKAESELKCSYIPSQEPRAQGTNNAQSMARSEGLFPWTPFPETPCRPRELKAAKHTLNKTKNDVVIAAYWGLFAEPGSGANSLPHLCLPPLSTYLISDPFLSATVTLRHE